MLVDASGGLEWIGSSELWDRWDGNVLYVARSTEQLAWLTTLKPQPLFLLVPLCIAALGLALVLSARSAASGQLTSARAACTGAETARVAQTRRGVSVIELLVVLGLLSLLMALLLPALQNARESSRRSTCQGHLHQIGIALHAHEAARGTFPYVHKGLLPLPFGRGGVERYYVYSVHAQLLPYLGEQALFDSIDFQQPEIVDPFADVIDFDPPGNWGVDVHPANRAAGERRLPLFICPSDSPLLAPGNSYRAGLGVTAFSDRGRPTPPIRWRHIGDAYTGAFVLDHALPPQDFADGLSNTVMFSEKIVGHGQTDSLRPVADYFRSAYWYSSLDEELAACAARQDLADGFRSNGGLHWLLCGYRYTCFNHDAPPNSPVPDCVHPGQSLDSGLPMGSFAARSWHPGGVNVLMGDGSVRFVNQAIDLNVWRALGTRRGGEIVSSF